MNTIKPQMLSHLKTGTAEAEGPWDLPPPRCVTGTIAPKAKTHRSLFPFPSCQYKCQGFSLKLSPRATSFSVPPATILVDVLSPDLQRWSFSSILHPPLSISHGPARFIFLSKFPFYLNIYETPGIYRDNGDKVYSLVNLQFLIPINHRLK